MTKGIALFLSTLAVGALTGASGLAAGRDAAAAPTVRLKAISTRVHAKGASLVIEATEPVPYATSRPDPLTILLDFRNVGTDGLAPAVGRDERSPIVGVGVERAESLGAPVARVRVALAEAVGHTVRSDRNAVIVEFDRSPVAGAAPVPAAAPQASSGRPVAVPMDPPAVDPMTALNARVARPAAAVAVAMRAQAAASLVTQAAPAQAPAPAAAQTSLTQAPAQSGTGRTYTGHPISLDFQGADLRAVLRTFSEISGLNIVIDPAVQGSVDVVLNEVPWDQALDLILRANKLGYLVDGTIVRIAPLSVLADEESQRRKLAEEQALAGELRVLTRTLSYARAQDLQPLLTRSALSQRGTVQVDPRTNTLIITDLQDRLTTADDLIGTLDRAQPQVEIEARIIETSKEFSRALGVQWGAAGRVDPSLGNTTNLAFPNNGSLAGRAGPTQGPGGAPTAVNLGVAGASSSVGLSLGSINGAFNLDVALSAMEESRHGRLLSTPKVTTQNNVQAEMTQGTQIPVQTVSNNTVTTTFKDAALSLKVTPQITSAGTVIMMISLENSFPDPAPFGIVPSINTQRAITTVLVRDGDTTVIGGVYSSTQRNTSDRTPGLGQIPLLKWLFKRDSVDDDSRELMIFITPRIVKG